MPDEAPLTARQRYLLHALRFREAERPRLCWLADEPRGRYGLVVPTLHGTYEVLLHVSGKTLRVLHGRGLIRYGPDQQLPADVAAATRPHRSAPPSSTTGSTVEVTPAGVYGVAPVNPWPGGQAGEGV